ncbi:hypothetical protein GTY44_16520 [Streptomyces sp. SID5914]|nr:hypothetical protein [Streptomyces sp. SID5914]MZG15072.1 hypothetical protein [Streptomyces sp. SID5914]
MVLLAVLTGAVAVLSVAGSITVLAFLVGYGFAGGAAQVPCSSSCLPTPKTTLPS